MALENSAAGAGLSRASDGSPVELGPKKQRAVLAMLALDAGRTVSTERLARGLWGKRARHRPEDDPGVRVAAAKGAPRR